MFSEDKNNKFGVCTKMNDDDSTDISKIDNLREKKYVQTYILRYWRKSHGIYNTP